MEGQVANEEINVNRNWSFDINLSGIEAPTGKAMTDLPKGFYQIQITDMYINETSNPDRVVIKTVVTDGAYKGMVRTDGLNRPKSAEDKVRYYWRALAESVGYSPTELDAGNISFRPESFVGRQGYIHFVPKDKSAKKGEPGFYEDITWLAKSTWMQQKMALDANQSEGTVPSAAKGNAILEALQRQANANA